MTWNRSPTISPGRMEAMVDGEAGGAPLARSGKIFSRALFQPFEDDWDERLVRMDTDARSHVARSGDARSASSGHRPSPGSVTAQITAAADSVNLPGSRLAIEALGAARDTRSRAHARALPRWRRRAGRRRRTDRA